MFGIINVQDMQNTHSDSKCFPGNPIISHKAYTHIDMHTEFALGVFYCSRFVIIHFPAPASG